MEDSASTLRSGDGAARARARQPPADLAAPHSAFSPWYVWAVLLVLEAVMAVFLVPLVQNRRWGLALVTAVVMTSVIAPTGARARLPVKLPVGLELAIAFFVFATLFLGEVADFYTRFAWWDLLLHGSAGVLFCSIGLPLAYALQRGGTPSVALDPRLAWLFAALFATGVGSAWEIFEFVLQNVSGLPIQVPQPSNGAGLSDTMGDLILNAAGTAGTALCLRYASLRANGNAGMPDWVARFLEANPRFLRPGDQAVGRNV